MILFFDLNYNYFSLNFSILAINKFRSQIMPKEIKDIKELLVIARRKDAKSMCCSYSICCPILNLRFILLCQLQLWKSSGTRRTLSLRSAARATSTLSRSRTRRRPTRSSSPSRPVLLLARPTCYLYCHFGFLSTLFWPNDGIGRFSLFCRSHHQGTRFEERKDEQKMIAIAFFNVLHIVRVVPIRFSTMCLRYPINTIANCIGINK